MRHSRANATSLIVIVSSFVRRPDPLVSAGEGLAECMRLVGQHEPISDRCEGLSQPPNVSSAAPPVPAPASLRPRAKRHRNKPARMLAAGADSPVPARPAAARQPDRRSVAGTLPEPAGGKKLQPG